LRQKVIGFLEFYKGFLVSFFVWMTGKTLSSIGLFQDLGWGIFRYPQESIGTGLVHSLLFSLVSIYVSQKNTTKKNPRYSQTVLPKKMIDHEISCIWNAYDSS
jgi:hypothetical protein